MPKHQGKKRGDRPTAKHFLCFPLVTDESVRQLSDSLAYFRSVTTRPSEQDPDATPEREGSNEPARQSTLAESSLLSQRLDPELARKLQLLPETAHRPPGTYHFTLGTMDLSRQEDMDKAVTLLHEIDYLALLREAERTAAPRPSENSQGQGLQRATGAKEAEQQGEAIEKKAGLTLDRGRGNVEGSSDDEVSNSKQHADGRRRSASPKESHSLHKPEATRQLPNKANQDPSRPKNTTTAKVSPSPAVQTLKSLARTISPPPPASHSEGPQSKHPEISPPNPLAITLHSLGVFPSPSSARAFFAHPIDPTRRLKIFSTLIRERFNEAGLILDQRPLILHATVANLIYAKDGAKGAGRSRKEGGHTVDARDVLRFFNGEQGYDARARGVVKPPLRPDERIAVGTAGGIELEVSGQSNTNPHVVSGGEVGFVSAAPETTAQLQASRHPDPVRYVWARDIPITSIRICKMGAEPSDKPGWGLEYRAIAEAVFMPGTDQET